MAQVIPCIKKDSLYDQTSGYSDEKADSALWKLPKFRKRQLPGTLILERCITKRCLYTCLPQM